MAVGANELEVVDLGDGLGDQLPKRDPMMCLDEAASEIPVDGCEVEGADIASEVPLSRESLPFGEASEIRVSFLPPMDEHALTAFDRFQAIEVIDLLIVADSSRLGIRISAALRVEQSGVSVPRRRVEARPVSLIGPRELELEVVRRAI